jgi:uncharacterized iron-regulated membrane protein
MLAAIGAIFGSFRIYLYIGLAIVGLLLFAYVEHLKAEAAGAEATVSVQAAALQTDQQSITQLQLARKQDQAALEQAHDAVDQAYAAAQAAQEAINAIPEPKTCNTLDARDRTAIDGVRRIIGSGHPDQHH